MDEEVLRIRVGVFVVFATMILAVLIFLNSEGSFWAQKYTLYVKPASAPGVTRGTPVRKNGILIGRVGSVNTQDDHVVLTLEINKVNNIFENEVCSIGSESFLGDAVVEILPETKILRGELLTNGNLITKYSVKRNPLEIVDVALNLESEITKTLDAVREAGAAVGNAGLGIETLTSTVQDAFTDETSDVKSLIADIRLMSQKSQTALDNFNRMFENINAVVGDPDLKGEFEEAIATLPEIFNEIKITIADTRETINSYRKVSEKASVNLDNITPFTATLKTEGPGILVQANDSLKNVDELIEKVGTFAETLSKVSQDLSNSEGTIGKLLSDPALHNAALGTVEDVRREINDVFIRLEPMLNDLRMFSDSLARDARQLGIKGALDKRPLGTGYKGSTIGRERSMRR